MSFLTNAKMAANMAFSPIMAGARQARSYAKPMANLGWNLSKQVVTHATGNGLAMKAGIGAAIGAAGGAGYAATGDRPTAGSIIRAGIGGAILGGGAGGAYGIGRSAYALRGTETAMNLGANARLLTRDMRMAGRATVGAIGDMSRYFAGAGADATMSSVASGLYGRARGAMGGGIGSRMTPGMRSAYGRMTGGMMRGVGTARSRMGI